MKLQKLNHLQRTFWCASAILLVTASLAMAQSAQRKLLPGHVPTVVSSLQPIGRLDATKSLKLSLGLPLRNQAALSNLLAQIYDPASPSYHHYLSPDEFTAQFGPTEQDYAAVVAFATNQGFHIVAQHPNRMLLEVSAMVPDIERALQVTLRTYQHPTETRTFYAPDTEPSIAADVPISSIGGLQNYARPHPAQLRHKPITSRAHNRELLGSGPNGVLGGFDYRAAYAPGVSLNGSGQQVGLLEFDGYYASDIESYVSQMGLRNVPLSIVLLDGFSGTPTTGQYSGNGEVALDIEMAISMAPALSQVVVYEADPNNGLLNDILAAMSENTAIKQFSCSWSSATPTLAERTNMDNYFEKMAAQGQTFFCASGDSGAYTNDVAIDVPTDDPYVTCVGGTTLGIAGPGGPWLSETVWNPGYGPGSGSSGGVSDYYPIPAWQKGVNMSTSGGSTTYRNIPDVAMVADNIFIVADDGYNEVAAGTSAAAPLWAGYAALVNEQATNNKVAPIGFLNPALYRIGTNAAFTSCLDDVTVGNNTNGNAKQYFAVSGYDLCTGWGSANGSSLLVALTQPDGFLVTPGRGPVGNGPVGGPFSTSAQTFLLTNNGRSSCNWSVGNTAAWLNVSTTSGTLTPSGAATSVSVAINSAATSLAAGVYTANLTFTNLTSGLTQVRQFTLQVDQNLVLDESFESEEFSYWTLTGDEYVYEANFVDDGTYTYYSPEDGDFFAAFGQVTTLAYLSQTLPTRSGEAYQLSFWLANLAGQNGYTPNQFQVQWNTNGSAAHTIFNQVDMGTFDWNNMVFTVVASTNITTLRFGFRNDNGFFTLDNVTLTPLGAPAFQSASVTGGTMQLTWTGVSGLQYQVQYVTNLTQANWVTLASAAATGSTMTTTDTVGTNTARFYRILAP